MASVAKIREWEVEPREEDLKREIKATEKKVQSGAERAWSKTVRGQRGHENRASTVDYQYVLTNKN